MVQVALTRTWRSLVLLCAVLWLLEAAATEVKQVGCWWYRDTGYTNRTLASIIPNTCTYVNVGSVCFFNAQPNGRLDHSPECRAETLAVVTDARAALRVNPGLRFKWVVSGGKELWMSIWNSTKLTATLVEDLRNWTRGHADVAHGISLDYEEHYDTPEPGVVNGLTAFLRTLWEANCNREL